MDLYIEIAITRTQRHCMHPININIHTDRLCVWVESRVSDTINFLHRQDLPQGKSNKRQQWGHKRINSPAQYVTKAWKLPYLYINHKHTSVYIYACVRKCLYCWRNLPQRPRIAFLQHANTAWPAIYHSQLCHRSGLNW